MEGVYAEVINPTPVWGGVFHSVCILTGQNKKQPCGQKWFKPKKMVKTKMVSKPIFHL